MDIMQLKVETHACPEDRRYSIVLDYRQAFPNDPGQGTPAMVEGPKGLTGTFFCVLDTGEIGGEAAVPQPVMRWLESMQEYVEGYVDAAFDAATANAA